MTNSESTSLNKLTRELDEVRDRIKNVHSPKGDFVQALEELRQWKVRATKTVGLKFSKPAASELKDAGNFNAVSSGDFSELDKEVERHRRVMSKLAEQEDGPEPSPVQPTPPKLPSTPSSSGQHNGGNRAGKDGGNDQYSLLVKLGKRAGVGGMAIGTFVILLGKLIFPTLGANQASLFMILSYGVAVVGLIVWALQVSQRRFVPIALAIFAFGLAWVGWLVLRSTSETLGYNVRVTVVNPSQTPVNDAHVWSTLGGEAKKVEGGWEISVPPVTTIEKRQVTIYAEVASQGWRGNSDLSLLGEHSPAVSVQLKKSGESPVRGIVLDKRGNAVPSAQVSVVGYGKEAVSTDANGGFELPTHTSEGDTVQLHAERAPYTAANYPDFKVGSGPAILVLKDADEPKSGVVRRTSLPPKVEQTGDKVIDRVLANLASLKQLQRPPTESQLASTLAPLFSRPAFYGIREEDWRYFLYPLCRTRLLLEEYVNQFKSRPEVGENLQQAIERMVALQNEVAKLYGPTFSITEHIERYIHNKNAFIDSLPQIVDPKPEYFDARDREIRGIRNLLRSAGLPLKQSLTDEQLNLTR